MQVKHLNSFFLFLLLLFPLQSNASISNKKTVNSQHELKAQIDRQIRESYDFFGLAIYLNQIHFFSYTDQQLMPLASDDSVVELGRDSSLLVVGRFNVLILQADGQIINLKEGEIKFDTSASHPLQYRVVSKPEVGLVNEAYESLRYHQLYTPLAALSRGLEWVLRSLGNHMNWGFAIIVMAVLIKILLIPINVLTVRSQRKVSQVQAKLMPELAEIKANFDGEEAHNKIMAAHKHHGVSPFFTLKPLMSTLIQLPVLIAVFNVLAEMPELRGATFLWIGDLAYPDVIVQFSSGISMFGDKISLLPVLMTIIALLASYAYKDQHLPEQAAKAQRKKLLLMAMAFFVLFYPFPASMVMYWAMANLLQFIQQNLMRS